MGFKSKEEVLSFVGGKVLVFGTTGTGKSTFAGTFPNINLVDSEDGNTYYIENNPNIKGVTVINMMRFSIALEFLFLDMMLN